QPQTMKSTLCLIMMASLAWLAAIGTAQSQITNVTLIESNRMTAAFAKGTPLVENSQFKIHAARRDGPGIAEIHTRDTDIFHVLEGSATLITGGKAIEPKTIAPDEIRGKEIEGGESRRLSKGDVIIIPSGVPHWFKQVDGPLVYYVVK